MSVPSVHPLLEQVLRVVPRRYQLPSCITALPKGQDVSPEETIALVIEQARCALAASAAPSTTLQCQFTEALAHMIHAAMRPDVGDPAVQAIVLRQCEPIVQEYASLSARAHQDRRRVGSLVDAIAHPAKLQRIPTGAQCDVLAQLHSFASSSLWSELHNAAQRLLATHKGSDESWFIPGVKRVLASPALGRLQRLDALTSDDRVIRYQGLCEQRGPAPGSRVAAARGSRSRARGAAIEATVAKVLNDFAALLNLRQDDKALYRVVTSLRVPSSIPGPHEHAKTEWDAVLLRQALYASEATPWDVCLMIEAKASVDAATSDFSRLLRGLRLLSNAKEHALYSFHTQQGRVRFRGAALRQLPTDASMLKQVILYCCDAPVDTKPRVLSSASRMRLLSAPACIEFAHTLKNNGHADRRMLEPVWHNLLESPRWQGVLHQYPMLYQLRQLMVHTSDLSEAIRTESAARITPVRSAEKRPHH